MQNHERFHILGEMELLLVQVFITRGVEALHVVILQLTLRISLKSRRASPVPRILKLSQIM